MQTLPLCTWAGSLPKSRNPKPVLGSRQNHQVLPPSPTGGPATLRDRRMGPVSAFTVACLRWDRALWDDSPAQSVLGKEGGEGLSRAISELLRTTGNPSMGEGVEGDTDLLTPVDSVLCRSPVTYRGLHQATCSRAAGRQSPSTIYIIDFL